MDMVHLPGKGMGSRRVPLLLQPATVDAMEVLVKYREQCRIPVTNVYFFAAPSANSYINGWQAMQNVSQQAGLSHPELIHSTLLRKYIATVMQVGIYGTCFESHCDADLEYFAL
jgi:hypothetical protein